MFMLRQTPLVSPISSSNSSPKPSPKLRKKPRAGDKGPKSKTTLSQEKYDVDQKSSQTREKAFMALVKQGDVKAIQSALNQGEPVTYLDYSGASVLHVAIENEQLDVVNGLLNHPVVCERLLNLADSGDRTPLSLAIVKGHQAIFDRLMAVPQMQYHRIQKNKASPLHFAVCHGRLDMLNVLLAQPDWEKVINKKCSSALPEGPLAPIIIAAIKGHDHIIHRLLQTKKVNINQKKARTNFTALSYALFYRHFDAALCLINHGALHLSSEKSIKKHLALTKQEIRKSSFSDTQSQQLLEAVDRANQFGQPKRPLLTAFELSQPCDKKDAIKSSSDITNKVPPKKAR